MTNDYAKPFSGPNYQNNVARARSVNMCCVICGRTVRTPLYWVEVVEGGARFASRGETDRPDSLGAFPVGSDCVKRVPPSAVYSDCDEVRS